MTDMQWIVYKIGKGDGLTNEELMAAITHYEALQDLLAQHGEKYHLVWKDAYMTLIQLKEFRTSRQQNNSW